MRDMKLNAFSCRWIAIFLPSLVKSATFFPVYLHDPFFKKRKKTNSVLLTENIRKLNSLSSEYSYFKYILPNRIFLLIRLHLRSLWQSSDSPGIWSKWNTLVEKLLAAVGHCAHSSLQEVWDRELLCMEDFVD